MAYIILQLNIILLLFLTKITKNNIFIYILVLILILFSGLRYNVGVDYFSYENHFNLIFNNYDSNLEYGIQFIVKIVNIMYGTPQLVFLILSFVTIAFFSKFIRDNSKDYFISWIIFISYGTFYLGSLNLVKQYVAISIFAYSIKYIIHKKFLIYCVLVIVASLFHKSALILLPMYLLGIKLKYYHYLVIATLFYFLISMVEYLISYTPYAIYLDERWSSTMNNDRNIIMTYIFISSNLFILFSSRIVRNIQNSHIYINMAFVSLLLILASLFIDYLPNMFFYRVNNYFMISYIILISYYISKLNGFIKAVGSTIVVLLMYIYFFLTIYYKGSIYNLMPYNMNLELFF